MSSDTDVSITEEEIATFAAGEYLPIPKKLLVSLFTSAKLKKKDVKQNMSKKKKEEKSI